MMGQQWGDGGKGRGGGGLYTVFIRNQCEVSALKVAYIFKVLGSKLVNVCSVV